MGSSPYSFQGHFGLLSTRVNPRDRPARNCFADTELTVPDYQKSWCRILPIRGFRSLARILVLSAGPLNSI